MNLSDQLTELRRNVLRDFSTQVSGNTDQLWSDDVLVSYIGDAERRFCRHTSILRDADTPQVTQVVLHEGVSRYMLHSSIHAVISGRYDVDQFDLNRIGRTLLNDVVPIDTIFFDPSNFAQLSPGRPVAYSTDELLVFRSARATALVVYPVPRAEEEGKIIQLRVARGPLRSYSTSEYDLAMLSEIDEDYQLDVMEWAAYRALRNHDADAGDPADATTHRTAFEDAVEKCKSAMRSRLLSDAQFVFGTNAFTWVR